LGLELPKSDNTVYTFTTSLWNGRSKLFEDTHALTSSFIFNLPHSSTFSHVQFDIKSTDAPLGKVLVPISQLQGAHGVVTSPIADSSFVPIASITFHFSIVTPFSHPSLGLKFSRNSFPTQPTLVGHRGSGAEGSRALVEGAPRSHIRENTLLSFEKAGALGAHFVEFDVHLTSDLVPVIYHDFSIPHCSHSLHHTGRVPQDWLENYHEDYQPYRRCRRIHKHPHLHYPSQPPPAYHRLLPHTPRDPHQSAILYWVQH